MTRSSDTWIDDFWYEKPTAEQAKKNLVYLAHLVRTHSQMRKLNPFALTRIFYVLGACHTHNIRNQSRKARAAWKLIESEWIEAAQPKLMQFTAHDLSNTIWAAATLRVALPKEFTDIFFGAAQKKLSFFIPQSFSITLWAAATMGITPPKEFLDAFFETTRERLRQFTPQDLSNTIWAAASLSIAPPKEFLDAFFRATQQKLPLFNPQDLSNTVRAAASLSIAPPKEFLDAFFRATQQKLPLFNPQDLSNTLWAAAIISGLESLPEMAHEVLIGLLGKINVADFRLKGVSACKLASLRLFPLEQPMIAPSFENNNVSSGESYFCGRLMNAGAKLNEEAARIYLLDTIVDCALTTHSGTVLIEYDGPSHFIENCGDSSLQLNGGTRLMSALIRQMRPNQPLIRVPYLIADKMTDEQVKALIERLSEVTPGAYILADSPAGPVLQEIPCAALPFVTSSKRPHHDLRAAMRRIASQSSELKMRPE